MNDHPDLSSANDLEALMRLIPSVHELTEDVMSLPENRNLPRNVIVETVRGVLEDFRTFLRASNDLANQEIFAPTIRDRIARRLRKESTPPLQSMINGTGIILHTGLGRAPIAASAVDLISEVAVGYAPVEIDLETGKRGKRSAIVRDLLCQLTGAESATVVNNNAAAMLITLATLASNREVIVSRGELVEIGGSFRLPDVIEAGGAILREVGTTNKTRLLDFDHAINEQTAALLKVHPSNFRIEGFTQSASIDELASLGKPHSIPVIHDIGSGMLIDPAEYCLNLDEPNARDSIERGADLVLFSGDKLLGATQSGVIVGRADLIERIERNPMMRALRVDKITLAALGRTLQVHRDPARAVTEIPALRMATESLTIVRGRAEILVAALVDCASLASISIEESTAYLGGGSVPGHGVASCAVVIRPANLPVDELNTRLRTNGPEVMARVAEDAVWIDMRTVFDDQIGTVESALRNALKCE